MAVTNVPVSISASSQSIPIYLAPGYDSVLVQETSTYNDDGYLLSQAAGYLLAQGSGGASVLAGESPNVPVVMQLVLGTMRYTYNSLTESYVDLSGVAIVDGISTSGGVSTYTTAYPGYMPVSTSTTLTSTCVSNLATLYFLPTDDDGGTYAFETSGGAGNVQTGPDAGIPQGTIAWSSSGTSVLVAQAVGGYVAHFDAYGSPITITDSFSGVVLDPSTATSTYYGYVNVPTFGPYDFSNPSVVTAAIGGSNVQYSVTIGETNVSPGCGGP
jgi:hypothetical protein